MRQKADIGDATPQDAKNTTAVAPAQTSPGHQPPQKKRRKSPQAPKNRNANRGADRKPSEPIYGALDLGTNNCRLLVARRVKSGFQIVDAFSRIVRLGEGISSTGQLSAAAMDRTVDALKICAGKMTRRGVTRVRAIATEACRIAGNGGEFLDRVKAETGLKLDIVSTADEARLAVAGCVPLLDRDCRSALVFDIGGGSTELIWVDIEAAQPPRILDWISLSYGVVTLAEQYGGRDVSQAVFEKMVRDISAQLTTFAERRSAAEAEAAGGFQLMGTSGTVTTIAGVHLDLKRYDRAQVDGIWITCEQVEDVTRKLLAMTYEARAAHPCVGHGRADLVLAGCAILEAIRRAWPSERLRVADRGLREGILLSLISADEAKSRRRRRRKTKKRAAAHTAPAPAGN